MNRRALRLLVLLLASLALLVVLPACSGTGRQKDAQITTDDGEDQTPDAGDGGAGGDSAEADSEPDDDAGSPCTGAFPPYSGPPDQYSGVETLRDASLTAALEQLTSAKYHSLGYTGAKDALFSSGGIDVHNGQVECTYAGDLFLPSQLDQSGGFNTEHSWPQSEFSGDTTDEKADMHHLFATGAQINSCRNNYDYGDTNLPEVNCSRGGSGRGPRVGTGEEVFMVRPAKRGDIARAHFYFSVRYHLPIPDSEEAMLRCWHMQDPPDDEEKARNDAIEALQHNRNPFVDRPEFVGYISNF